MHAPECVSLLDWALSHKRHSVVILRASLENSVPMERHFHALHVVLDVDDDSVVLADLDAGPGDHSVGRQDSALDSVGQDALAMTPHGVGCIGGANLASAVNGVEKIAEKFRSELPPKMVRSVK